MKNIIFILIFITLYFTTYCQKYSVSELIKLQKNNGNFFEQMALKKGFEYSYTNDDIDVSIISYSHYNLKGKRKTNFINFYFWKINMHSVMYITSDRGEFVSLKTEVVKLGYKPYKTTTINNEINTYYKKNQLYVCFNTSTNVDENKLENQLFSIDVSPAILIDK